MNLPRRLLLRLRRQFRRRYPAKPMIPSGPHDLCRLGPRPEPGDRPPPADKMKLLRLLIYLLAAAVLAVAFTGCMSTTVTAPDGTVTVTRAPSPGVRPLAAAVLNAYSPRAIVIRETKGKSPGPARRRYLAPWRGPQQVACHDGPLSSRRLAKHPRTWRDYLGIP